ncbi:hypothetical protein [Streptomyces sp. NPDC087317]|uniref:hypothetical protein n=1 Tax=Streptomyces sp. NPDC087317 TaxID=3365784 RepID=UPI0038023AFA
MFAYDPATLTQLQLDGVTCAVCGQVDDRPMVSVGPAPSGLWDLYAHEACIKPAPSGLLVVGPVATPYDVADLRAHAFDIADQMGATTTYALHTDYRVTDFTAVYLTGTVTEVRDAPTLILVAEALAAGMEVHEPQPLEIDAEWVCGQRQTVRTVVGDDGEVWCADCRDEAACTWCGESGDGENLEIVETGATWIPLHAGCLKGLREHRPDVLIA